jgi:uncharacterized delta-60 repeat protein
MLMARLRTHRPRTLALERLDDRTAPAGLDPTFGRDGLAALDLGGNDLVKMAAAQPDGRVVAVAESFTFGAGGPAVVLARLNPDGTPDRSLGGDGTVGLPVPAVGEAPFGLGHARTGAVAVRPDGKVVVAASFVERPPATPTRGPGGVVYIPPTDAFGRFTVARLNPDGTPDPTFDGDGVATFALPGEGQTVQNLAVLPDGSVVLVAPEFVDVTPPGVIPPPGFRFRTPDVVVVKLTPDGRLDPAFGTGGVARFDPGELAPNDVRVAALPGGGLLVYGQLKEPLPGSTDPAGGIDVNRLFAARLTAAGAVDPGYGDGGRFTAWPDGGANSLGLAGAVAGADGSLLVLAVPRDVLVVNGLPQPAPYLFRVTPDGRADAGYGRHEVAPPLHDPDVWSRFDLVPAGDAGAYLIADRFDRTTVQRVTAAGAIDPAFGTDGVVVLPASDLGPRVRTLAAAAADAGGLVLAGWADPNGPTHGVLSNDAWFARVDADAPTPPPLPEPEPQPLPLPEPLPQPDVDPVGGVVWADVNGDGTNDRIAYAGPGGGTLAVTDGATGGPLVPAFAPYEASFTGGLQAAAADLDGDGKAEVIVAPDVGGSARVQVYAFAGGRLAVRDNFFAIDDPNFRGGARVAAGDLDGDGTPDLVVGAGPGGGPRVATFAGTGLLHMTAAPPKLVADFFAFPGADAARLRDGVAVAAGDFNGDGRAELTFGAGPGGAPRVFVLDGSLVAAGRAADAQAVPVANFYAAGDEASRGGVRVTVGDETGDGRPDLTAANPATGAVRYYDAAALVGSIGEPAEMPLPVPPVRE